MWQVSAEAIGRAFRVQPALTVPDLTAQILESAPAMDQPRRYRFRVRLNGRTTRLALAVVAIAQLTIGLFQLAGVPLLTTGGHAHAHGEQAHTVSETSAWGLAIGLGLLFAAWRTHTARGMLPIVTPFAVVVLAITTRDLIRGEVGFAHVADHTVLIAGLILLFAVYRQDRNSGTPSPTAAMPGDANQWPITNHGDHQHDDDAPTRMTGAPHRHLRPASRKRAA